MKKAIALIMALMLASVMVVGCGSSSSSTSSATPTPDTTEVEPGPVETEAPDTTEVEPGPSEMEEVELIIFAAASMTETLEEISNLYKEVAPNVILTFNFDSSGTLKTQIEEGADCDIFISAAQKQMNQLDINETAGENTDGLDYVLSDTRIDLLENKVALAVPDGNPAGIQSYEDLIAGLEDGSVFLAMGNEDVPVGQYTQKILTYYGLSEEDLAAAGVITYGSNVKEVTTQVSEATVDAGIIYQTDAYSAGLTVVDTATAAMCGQVIYPAAVLNVSQHQEEAQAFLDYLTGAEASAIFESVGFTAMAGSDGSTASGEPVELIVFAAASMTETLEEIADLYKVVAPNVTLTFNFDSSGTLKTQIEEGADCDIFISAAQKQMNQLDINETAGENTDGLDYVLSDTRIDLLENKVALAVPDGNPAGIGSYDDLMADLEAGSVLLAMGNEDVPVGQYTQKILTYYGLSEEALAASGVITYGSNVKEVTTQVSEATVDAGIIYQTDAYSAGLTVVDTATAEMCGQVVYPAAVLNITQNQDAAEAFLAYLTTAEASAVFESVGFTAMSGN